MRLIWIFHIRWFLSFPINYFGGSYYLIITLYLHIFESRTNCCTCTICLISLVWNGFFFTMTFLHCLRLNPNDSRIILFGRENDAKKIKCERKIYINKSPFCGMANVYEFNRLTLGNVLKFNYHIADVDGTIFGTKMYLPVEIKLCK